MYKSPLIYSLKVIVLIMTLTIVTSGKGAGDIRLHPNLVLTNPDLNEIISNINSAPLFKQSLEGVKKDIDKILDNPIDVPYPMDAGGGYTHEKHKQNYNEMYLSGILYKLDGDKKYFSFIKHMLDKYAELYPKLGKHPQGKKQTPGRLFWQSLNETVWLLHTIQAYDCIYNDLSEEERKNYEENIFNPMAQFFLEDCKHEFNLIHNHGTWIVAAVGMTGFVLGNNDYVNKALYGSDGSGESGFLAQLRLLFSPDGYYTEGGYYARYALWPFFIFAESIKNNLPEINIYQYRDSILKKAFNSALQVTYTNGEFIPINDAVKDKTWLTPELIFASNFTYVNYEKDKELLNLVKLHKKVSLTGPGFKVAQDLKNITNIPEFTWKSIDFTDGPNGDQGGVTILRYGNSSDQEALFFKYGSHGLSHGHFDKLSFLFYDQGKEIIQDYGAARFVNIEQKYGGRYLPENDSYAKQTIAHNTLVVDGKSQFDGKRSVSQKHHSVKYAIDYSNTNFQYTSAYENNAYNGVNQHRTICMLNDSLLDKPIIVDILDVTSEDEHQYDYPFYYLGQFLSLNCDYEPFVNSKSIMGTENGYQHLWKNATADPDSTLQFTWLNGKRFYSLTTNTNRNSKIFMTQIGASDPDFNLRQEPGIIIREKTKSHCFATVIEPHGNYNPIIEKTVGAYGKISDVNVLLSNTHFTITNIKGGGIDWLVCIAKSDPSNTSKHKVEINQNLYTWFGPVAWLRK